MDRLVIYPKFQAFDDNGNLLAGGFVYTYVAGTATPLTTYSDRVLSTPNSNPVELDNRGEAKIFCSSLLKIVLKDSDNVPITGGTVDNLRPTDLKVLRDDDGDTKIQVEESADEDKIRFDTAGVERAVLDSSGLSLIVDLAVAHGGTGSSTAAAALIALGLNAIASEINAICDDPVQIALQPVGASDHTYSGMTATMQVDANATGFGAALHMDTDGNWIEADADAVATMPCQALALETGTGSKKVLKRGFIRDDTWDWTVGDPIYVSETTGALTQTAPSGSGDQVQVVGYATHADRMFFNPSLVLVEVG